MGPRPTVQVTEPAMIKEILADYYKFQKSRGNPLFRKLMKGLVDVEGDQWVKHRKIINPAFNIEKLKVHAFCLVSSNYHSKTILHFK